MKCFILFKLKTDFTVWAGPQVGPGRFQAGMVAEAAGLLAGPGRCQAGHMPESAGLVAGPGWALGRVPARGVRPPGRPRPGARPGDQARARLVNATTGVADAVTAARDRTAATLPCPRACAVGLYALYSRRATQRWRRR